MTNRSYKPLFSRFLAAHEDRLHFAAHSHHFWPDVTAEAQSAAWELACAESDEKWGALFGEVLPRAKRGIAGVLGLTDPDSLALAPNTHELLVRLLSCFGAERPVRVLSTDGEFHSFRRQADRWVEAGLVELERVPVEPFATFSERFLAAVARGGHDLVFVSQVFFDSGFLFDRYTELADACPDEETFLVLDGYHGYCAVPTDLAAIEQRVFYLGGSYKYAMGGEGACFLHCPSGYGSRPVNTGWFAGFGSLEARDHEVGYDAGGNRFMGATFDPTAWLRVGAVFDLLEREGLSIADVHAHVQALQRAFVDGFESAGCRALDLQQLLPGPELRERGHFLTFRTDSAGDLQRALRERGVVTDHRGDRLRFGFGLYQDADDVRELLARLADLG